MKKIDISDKELFSKYYNQEIINSEYQFSTLFAWQHVYEFMYEVWDDCLLVFGKQTNGDTQVYYPLGNIVNLRSIVKHLENTFNRINQPINIRPLSKEMKEKLIDVIDFDIEVGSKESYSDYIYDYQKLKGYVGHEYKRKRHELHRFCSLYNFRYESINNDNREEALQSLNRILGIDKSNDPTEYAAYCKLFNSFDNLDLRGGVLKINGVIEAVSVGEEIGNMVLMHIRRCNKDYVGIYPAMLYFVLNNEFDNNKYTIVNSQDDLGDESIRKAKLSYKPIYRLEKFYIKGKK